MIAAIYARKSTDQSAIADDQKSVSRQIDHARAYAVSKGWTVDDRFVFVDDGISGAEFANRPGFLRLMNALKPRAPFQFLVMSEESRLGREAIETAYALKQLVQAGVRVFFYLENRERTLDSPTDKIMMSLTAFADELEREKARQRTYDAMQRKAKAGHVTGGRVFGYRNVTITSASGERSHVMLEVNDDEAVVVRQIFDLCAAGAGLKSITKQLNAAGALSPRSQQGRPRAWAPSSVRSILHRELYRGQRIWNKTKKRDAWGQSHRRDRPVEEWLTIEAPDLRIVPEGLWCAARARIVGREEAHRHWCRAGKPAGALTDGRGVRTRYFLTGFSRCHHCGGSMQAVSRSSSRGRSFRYVCASYWNRGATVCPNGRMAAMDLADTAVSDLLRAEVLKPRRIERALDRAIELIHAVTSPVTQRPALERQLAHVEAELANLADTAARGGAVPVILEALARREQDRQRVRHALAAEVPINNQRLDRPEVLRAQLRGFLNGWGRLLDGNRSEARGLLDVALWDRIAFEPESEGGYRLHVPLAFDQVIVAAIPDFRALQDRVASPPGFEPGFWP